MYIEMKYTPERYVALRRALSKISDWSESPRQDFAEEKRELFKGVGVSQILRGNRKYSIDGEECRVRSFAVDELEKLECEINRYLERFEGEFESDRERGVLGKLVLGEQQEFEVESLVGGVKLGPPYVRESLSGLFMDSEARHRR